MGMNTTDEQIQAECLKAQSRIMDTMMMQVYWTPPLQPITVNDAAVALELGREFVIGWIQDLSYAIPYSKKDRRAFLTEWRALLWDLHSYLTGDKESKAGVLVLTDKDTDSFRGLTARYSSLSSAHYVPNE